MSTISHSDNTLVKRGRGTYPVMEYLSLSMSATDSDWKPYEVSLCRYCVPGRYDQYTFDWVPSPHCGVGPRLRYFTNTHLTLTQVAAMVAEDLDRPRVVELLVEAAGKEDLMHYTRTLIHHLLPALAPRSKALKACVVAYEATLAARKARKARFAAEKASVVGVTLP